MPYNHKFKSRKGKRSYSKFRKGRKGRKAFKNRGMQRIRKHTFSVRNIGGDRAYAKLRYVIGKTMGISNIVVFNSQELILNVGASSGALGNHTINSVFGSTPNLSQLAAFYTRYRIRGIKYKITAWPTTAAYEPLLLFTNAQTSEIANGDSVVAPSPAFITPNISTMPEQRWAKYRVIKNPQAGGSPTRLSVYYSVNKVFGPDQIVKNDESFTGRLQPGTPYWDGATNYRPEFGPWA